MEPLSIIGSVIAIGQASDRTISLLVKARTLFEAPREIDLLFKEISDAKLILSSLSQVARVAEDSNLWRHADLNPLKDALQTLRRQILAIEELLQYTLLKPSGSVSRSKWMLQKTNVERHRQSVHDSKTRIMIQLDQLNVLAQIHVGVTLRSIHNMQLDHMLQRRNDLSAIEARFDQQETNLQALTLDFHCQIRKSINVTTHGTPEVPITEIETPKRFLTQKLDANNEAPSPSNTATQRPCEIGCGLNCQCQCHGKRRTVMQARITSLVGILFQSYRTISQKSPGCNIPSCRRRSLPSLTVAFCFPQTLIHRAMLFAFYSNPMPMVTISFPRIVPTNNEMFRSIRFGDLDKVHHLFSHGLSSPADLGADIGLTLLSFAISHQQLDVCALLLSWGADPFAPNHTSVANCAADLAWNFRHEWKTPPEHRKKLTDLFPEPDLEKRSFSQLHKVILGIYHGSVDQILRKSRLTIDSIDDNGQTALHWATRIGDVNLVNKILRCGSNPDLRDNAGRTALYYAAETGALQCVESLIDAGANASTADKWDESPLHLAASYANNDIVQRLLKADASVNAQNYWGETPLLFATLTDNSVGVSMLLEAGADMEVLSKMGDTALVDAVWANAHNVLKLLLDNGARVDIVNKQRKTILHCAAQHADLDTLRLLHENGLKPMNTKIEACDDNNNTPRDKLRQRSDEAKTNGSNEDSIEEAFERLLEKILHEPKDEDVFFDANEEMAQFQCQARPT